jgi:hypothetical protein
MMTFALFGGGVVHLRYADFTSPEVVHSYSIMGGQTILVPPEVNVDLRGVGERRRQAQETPHPQCSGQRLNENQAASK